MNLKHSTKQKSTRRQLLEKGGGGRERRVREEEEGKRGGQGRRRVREEGEGGGQGRRRANSNHVVVQAASSSRCTYRLADSERVHMLETICIYSTVALALVDHTHTQWV